MKALFKSAIANELSLSQAIELAAYGIVATGIAILLYGAAYYNV